MTSSTKESVGIEIGLRSISKRFGATQALRDVSVEIDAGSIHGVVGENGAGKSTLGKVIGGVYTADSGELVVDGEAVSRWTPARALASGIATIQQELSLVPERTVQENVFLGIEQSRFGILSGSERERYRALDAMAGFDIDPRTLVSSLRLADQQKVEVLRALARNARLIIMDEPTSSLTKDEADLLHEVMDRLRSEGRTVVYVTHFLDEVLQWADVVTVMRDGEITRTSPAETETKSSLIEGMLGRSFDATFPPLDPVAHNAPIVLSVSEMTGTFPREVSFEVRAGEVVGLAGLVGSGRTEIARMLFGADPIESGSIEIEGQPLANFGPQSAIDAGLVMLPEDRRGLGLVMTQNVRENVTLPRLADFSRAGTVQRSLERASVKAAIERLNIVPPRVDGSLQFYSGGNQQKTLFAKWTLKQPNVMVLDEPTRGVDVGAKRSIYEAIVKVASEGTGVVLISSELEEVVYLSHRILLVSEGRIFGEERSGEIDVDEILRRLFQEHQVDDQ